MALGSTQPLVKMSTRNISWGKGGRCVRLTTSTPSCAECHRSLGAQTSWNPLGHTGPVTGLLYLYLLQLLMGTRLPYGVQTSLHCFGLLPLRNKCRFLSAVFTVINFCKTLVSAGSCLSICYVTFLDTSASLFAGGKQIMLR